MELKMRTRNVGTDPACSPTLMILRAATGWCRMGMRPILTRHCANAAPQTTALKPRCMAGHGATMARPQCGWGRFATRKRMAVKYFTALWIRQPWLWSQTKQLIQRYQESLSSLKSACWPCSFCSIIAIIHFIPVSVSFEMISDILSNQVAICHYVFNAIVVAFLPHFGACVQRFRQVATDSHEIAEFETTKLRCHGNHRKPSKRPMVLDGKQHGFRWCFKPTRWSWPSTFAVFLWQKFKSYPLQVCTFPDVQCPSFRAHLHFCFSFICGFPKSF